MRKTLLLLLTLLLFGCTKIDKNDINYLQYVEDVIKNDNNFFSKNSNGFKYYLPKGVIVKKEKNNNILLSSDSTNIYFFIDIINYYYNNKIIIDNSENYDYYKTINDEGFLIVDENNDNYLIKLSYNNCIMEFYTEKEKIPKLLTISSIILNSVEFNDNIINNQIKDGYKNNSEKIYEINELKKTNSKFSQYLNSYEEVKKEENQLPD